MSFRKAQDLMRLAEMASTRDRGVCLSDVSEAFGVNQRTAQRMMREFETAFPTFALSTDQDRRRWWKLTDEPLLHMQGVQDSELAALDTAIQRAEQNGADLDVAALNSLRDRLLGVTSSPHARRAEVDATEAMLKAEGLACRPGPYVPVDAAILDTLTAGIEAAIALDLIYQGSRDPEPRVRKVEPYGLLRGERQYLVAKDTENDGQFRRFRLDRIVEVHTTHQFFERNPAFDLNAYAARAFGSFDTEVEYGPVIWRFSPSAAPLARAFEFHPTQQMTDEPDGSLRVAFTASGWIEMVWYLRRWGDQVEVIAPEPLRAMVEGFQRGDLKVLP